MKMRKYTVLEAVSYTVAAVICVVGLSGCGAVAEASGIATKTVELDSGGTVECVVAAGTDGGLSIDCIDPTYSEE